ncbi:hypothetical protein HNR42_002685 [Deinobacterium chartae]|uniref:Uncharacterized protein n=1 Tax=Deinobacterium chartae TaxID=521158 RepID=A0A841I0Q3_9DEIO|nr:hypothetical protein [Deinobacterium chartae]MBB6099247.1 hypothetical protein [Deinobacterium chartae]
MNAMILAAALRESGSDVLKVVGLSRPLLTEQGIFEVPLLVEDDQERYLVFPYGRVSGRAAAHYGAVRALAAASGLPRPVYYAPGNLEDATPDASAPPLARVDQLYLSRAPRLPPGTYAMWWPLEEDPDFGRSACCALLERYYMAMDRVAPYVMATVAARVGWLPGGSEPLRVPLPAVPVYADVLGPENGPMRLSASRDQGLRVHFHESVSLVYRHRFLNLLTCYAEAWLLEAERQRLPLEPLQKHPPSAWFAALKADWSLRVERGETVEPVGILLP